jgi:predicted nucleotidyltransferase
LSKLPALSWTSGSVANAEVSIVSPAPEAGRSVGTAASSSIPQPHTGVTNLSVFGSVARGEDRPDSDVDLLATLPPGMGLIGLGRLRDELQTLLDATVDLVPAEDLKPEVAQRVAEDVVAL